MNNNEIKINFVVATGSSSISHILYPAEIGSHIFATGSRDDCDTCHQDNVVTWQWTLRLLSIQTLSCF